MRLKDLTAPINESTCDNMPLGTKHSLPHAVIIPDMDLYYEYYKFVINMACHPELENADFSTPAMRDVPIVVPYTSQEHDMIVATAKRMGKKPKEVAYKGSQELPEVNKTSPVMKFDMFESICEKMPHIRTVQEKLKSLYESTYKELTPDIKATISPTITMPKLINSDTYKQYRYAIALAAARAVLAGEVEFNAESAWNEALTGVAYSPEDIETFKLANKLMNTDGIMLSDTPSSEPNHVHTTSPVFKFNMFESSAEQIRKIINDLDAE